MAIKMEIERQREHYILCPTALVKFYFFYFLLYRDVLKGTYRSSQNVEHHEVHEVVQLPTSAAFIVHRSRLFVAVFIMLSLLSVCSWVLNGMIFTIICLHELLVLLLVWVLWSPFITTGAACTVFVVNKTFCRQSVQLLSSRPIWSVCVRACVNLRLNYKYVQPAAFSTLHPTCSVIEYWHL